MSNWIKSIHKLPDDGDEVIAYDQGQGVCPAIYQNEEWTESRLYYHYTYSPLQLVSHWMPLPEEPNEPS